MKHVFSLIMRFLLSYVAMLIAFVGASLAIGSSSI